MYQIAPRIWNEIGETVPLKTEWAKQMFPLPDDQMTAALNREEKRLSRTDDPMTAVAYLLVMPLLWERDAIAQFKEEHPETAHLLPEIGAVDEAVMLAASEYPLDERQKQRLALLLQQDPR